MRDMPRRKTEAPSPGRRGSLCGPARAYGSWELAGAGWGVSVGRRGQWDRGEQDGLREVMGTAALTVTEAAGNIHEEAARKPGPWTLSTSFLPPQWGDQ